MTILPLDRISCTATYLLTSAALTGLAMISARVRIAPLKIVEDFLNLIENRMSAGCGFFLGPDTIGMNRLTGYRLYPRFRLLTKAFHHLLPHLTPISSAESTHRPYNGLGVRVEPE